MNARSLRVFLFAMLAIASSAASAADRGRWLCAHCYIGDIQQGQPVGTTHGEVVAFIASEVNKFVDAWKANDTVTVCNGSMCLSVVYHPSGKFFALGPPINDSRTGYKNAGPQGVRFLGIDLRQHQNHLIRIQVNGYWQAATVEMPEYGYSSTAWAFMITDIVIVRIEGGGPEDAAVFQ